MDKHGTRARRAGGERGVVSDPAGPGKTVYLVLSLEITQAGAR